MDDECNSCCHGEVLRHNAETEMKVLGLHPIWVHRKATTFNGFWNEHDEWKVKDSDGHTTAVI